MLADDFGRDGFAVIANFKPASEIGALRARATEIVDTFDPSAGSGVFSTGDDSVRRDDYFLGSATKIRCFFEAEAFDSSGELTRPKDLSINKIGHAMHDLDPVFQAFSHGAELDRLVRELGVEDPRIYQSMYIFKQPYIGGEVGWHQDATYFATEPETVTTFWFALERADRNNGCLWIKPGDHHGPLRERFAVDGDGPRLERLDSTAWPAEGVEPIEVDAGALVVFHGLLPHYSAPNRSAASRHAYTLHVVDGRARYDPANWLQRPPDFPARGFV